MIFLSHATDIFLSHKTMTIKEMSMDEATLVLRSRLKNKSRRKGRDGKMSTVEIENQTVESGGQPVSQRESTIYIQ